MIRFAICDDNVLFARQLAEKVHAYANQNGVQVELRLFDSPLTLAEDAEEYDIILLDINMPEMDGIALARQIRKYHSDTFIVFITSYMEYALQGYEVSAFRYILKSQLDEVLPYCLDDILAGMLQKRKAWSFRFVEGESSVKAENILYIESQRHKLVFHLNTAEGERSLYAKLDEIEQQLDDVRFLRIHKSFLVNLGHVVRIKNYEAQLADGTLLPVPKQKYAEVKRQFVLLKGEI